MLKDATIEQYEDVVPKVIRIWKRKYQITEYVGCLEISKGGYKHVHMYVKTDKHVLALEQEWINLTGTKKRKCSRR